MLDAHCHLDDERFDGERDAVIERARAAGVTGLVVPGVSSDRWRRLPELRQRFREVRIGFGLHPQALDEMTPVQVTAALADLPHWLDQEGAVCVGETGLDRRATPPLEVQIALTRRHLEIAAERGLPVVLHCVAAHGALIELLEAHGPLAGMVHAYSGSPELVGRYCALGLHLGFGGAVTWPGAVRPLAALRAVPLERLLLETDAPDQTPHPGRRGRNEPARLAEIAAAVERILGDRPVASGAALGWD